MSCSYLCPQPHLLLPAPAPHTKRPSWQRCTLLVTRMVHCAFSHAFEAFYLLLPPPEMPFPGRSSSPFKLKFKLHFLCEAFPDYSDLDALLFVHLSLECAWFTLSTDTPRRQGPSLSSYISPVLCKVLDTWKVPDKYFLIE